MSLLDSVVFVPKVDVVADLVVDPWLPGRELSSVAHSFLLLTPTRNDIAGSSPSEGRAAPTRPRRPSKSSTLSTSARRSLALPLSLPSRRRTPTSSRRRRNRSLFDDRHADAARHELKDGGPLGRLLFSQSSSEEDGDRLRDQGGLGTNSKPVRQKTTREGP